MNERMSEQTNGYWNRKKIFPSAEKLSPSMGRSVHLGWDLLLLAWDFRDFLWQSVDPGVPSI